MKINQLLESTYTKLYHGSSAKNNIEKIGFSYDYIGKGNDQYGYGFYFTNKDSIAKQYFGEIIKASVTLKNPIKVKGEGNTREQFPNLTKRQAFMIMYRAPDIRNPDGPLSNWGDVRKQGFNKIIKDAAEYYIEAPYFSLLNDFYKDKPKEFLKAYNAVTGNDGVIVNFENGGKFIIAWFPEQIRLQKD